MKEDFSIADLLGAMMADGLSKRMTPPPDLQAQLDAAVVRYSNPRPFAVGDRVFAKNGTEWKRCPGLPAVVLAVRPDAPPNYSASPRDFLTRGIALDLRVGIWAPLVGVSAIWVSSTDFEPYDEAAHGIAPASEPAPVREPATAAA